MAVTFILGRAGTGKTRRCLEQIGALHRADPLGPPVYWLLPKQATFQAERELTAALGGFARARVVSFEMLGRDILTHCGDVGIPEVTPVGRRMVIGHLLRTHQKQLTYYGSSAHRAGLAAELDATFGEFERAGLDDARLDALQQSLEHHDPATEALREKLHDVHLLLRAYNAHVTADRLDPAKRLARILERVASCSLLRQAVVFVDDFYDFTAYERQLLVAVASAAPRTEIALLLDPDAPGASDLSVPLDDLSLFHRTERTYRSLRLAMKQANVAMAVLPLREPHRYGSPTLQHLQRNLFGRAAPPPAVTADVERFDAPDARAEVDAVARRIRAAVAGGLRYRDVAVLVRGLETYREIVSASFGEHGIPYFADYRRTASHHPLLQMVRACLLIARHNWPHDAVMTLVKSGLAGLSDDAADELENYVLHHRIRGRAWESTDAWQFQRELTLSGEDEVQLAPSEAERIDAMRLALVRTLTPLLKLQRPARPVPVREIATQLFAVLDGFKVRQRLAGWMTAAEAEGQLELRGEHEQVWAELVGLFEHMVDLLGNEPVTPADFIAILDSGLESFDLALTPPTVDQVLLGQIDRTRTPPVKLVFVLGLNEGQFPRAEREQIVLSDAERRTLRRRDVDLDDESDRQLLDERFLAYVTFTRASQALVLTRPLAEATGRSANPSAFWNELLRLAPSEVRHAARAAASDPAAIGTPRQLVSALMRWVRTGGAATVDAWPALYQWLADHPCADDAVDRMRYRAWRALSYTNVARLDPALAAQLFPMPLQATVAQLETMATCPFRHYAKYGLKLAEREAADVTGLDLHNAYHHVLDQLVGEVLQAKTDWCEQDPATCQERIRTHAADIGRRLRGELMLSSARNRYMLERIERTLELAVASMTEFNRRGQYRPAYAGLRFGGRNAPLPAHAVTTPAGRSVHLRGRIDRVDLNDRGTAFTVCDYKLSAGALSLDRVYHGLSLQLLTYLLVLSAGGEELTGRRVTPAAAFLLGLLRSPGSVDHPDEAMPSDHKDFHLRAKPRGMIDANQVTSFDKDLVEGHSPVVSAYVKKDGQLGNRHATDVAEPAELAALLQHVERRLGELADEVTAGHVAVEPYMMSRQTPCATCSYRSVCRFEPGVNRYRVLSPMRREEVLVRVVEEAPGD